MNKEEIFNVLYDKEKWDVWQMFLNIENSIEDSSMLYKYFDDIKNMLLHEKSHIKMRGFRIICKLSKWDNENKINASIYDLLKVLDDDKPTIIRQCLSSINNLLLYKKELSKQVEDKLKNIDLSKYKESMSPLIKKDIININEKGWNELIKSGKEFSNTSLPEYGPFMNNEEKFQIFKDVKGKKVLEIGCAKGDSLKYLLENGASEVYGVDISEEQIKKAKLNIPFGKFYTSEMTKNPSIPQSYFDYCLSLYSIGYTSNLDKTFEQISKYLKKDGIFVYCWTHPFFNCLQIQNENVIISKSYNDESLTKITKGENKVPMVQYNYKISTIINSMVKNSLVVERIIEDEPIQENHIGDYKSNYWDQRKIKSCPTTLIIVAKKLID